jgi:Carboxypeptidase regulatory-like domain
MIRRLFLATAVITFALLPRTAASQSGTASVTGTVHDSSGGAIPGASVRVVNETTRRAVEAVSDGQGVYRAIDLAPGTYRIETTLDGFEPLVRQLALDSGQTAAVGSR